VSTQVIFWLFLITAAVLMGFSQWMRNQRESFEKGKNLTAKQKAEGKALFRWLGIMFRLGRFLLMIDVVLVAIQILSILLNR